jgi:hypothetical protein
MSHFSSSILDQEITDSGATQVLILTSIQPRIADIVNPTRWHAWDTGYITYVDIYSYIEV